MTDGKTVKVGLGLYILNDRGQVLLGLRKAKTRRRHLVSAGRTYGIRRKL